eukprot:Phypoly_transcript_02697.p1 GENE.Phypoly_transcript_02697~~Phypoly_transcript_02697.p1  ORF type:complete len:777 (+),score=106.95 Phypoly_transcript_02697:66-2396(+)
MVSGSGSASLDNLPVYQKHLEAVVRDLFNGENILINARKEAKINKPNTSLFLELDIWIPSRDLCFEFQDDYHYVSTWYSHKTLSFVKSKDSSKHEIAKRKGITFIDVPCWWDGSPKSLSASILFSRPDLVDRTELRPAAPIPINPPLDFFEGNLQGVGELMLASFQSETNMFHSISSTDFWWVGEKYDGIRACWNATASNLYSRLGNKIAIPSTFAAAFPTIALDCELWSGRGKLQELLSLVRSSHEAHWEDLRLIAFDMPDSRVHHLPFEERYALVLRHSSGSHPFVITAVRMRCTSAQELQFLTQAVIGEKGEGLILRKPLSRYKPGRSRSLWKIKASREDTEALVVRVEDTKPILLKLPNGIAFHVPQTSLADEMRNAKLKKGDVVTVAFEHYSRKSIPVNPRITRIRKDMTWQHVLHEFVKQQQSVKRDAQMSLGYITQSDAKLEDRKIRLRNFFERFAASRNLNPTLPATWYSLSAQFMKLKNAHAILKLFNNSFAKAVTTLFPNIGAQESMFKLPYLPKQFWADIGNRRTFFTKFAKKKGFDAMSPKNWYKISTEAILSVKGGSSILMNYNGKLEKALMHLFPDIGLVEQRFKESNSVHWHKISTRRKFFENFAKQRGFAALDPSNWYPLGPPASESKDLDTLLSTFYGGSLPTALCHLFPEVNFVETKFATLPDGYWTNPDNHRKMFENFAREHRFDPFIHSNWYNINPDELREFQGANEVLDKYSGSIIKALLATFPDIGLDKKLLSSSICIWLSFCFLNTNLFDFLR